MGNLRTLTNFMDETRAETESQDPASLRRRVLERVRFEQSLGLEFLPRVKISAPIQAPASATAARPIAAVPMPPRPSIQAGQSSQVARVSPAATPPQVLSPTVPPADVPARWATLEARAKVCVTCVLHQARTNVVFGTGNRQAQLVFVGEGPGQDEDLSGEPFVGKAGQLLNKIIGAMGLKREDVYICNVVKCRPPGNRTPLPDEIAACSPFLAEQLELIAPKAIVALGGPAAKTLLRTETGITMLRGKWGSYKTIPVMPTFHPAFVLRTYTEEVRRQVWEDMKKVMEKLKAQA